MVIRPFCSNQLSCPNQTSTKKWFFSCQKVNKQTSNLGSFGRELQSHREILAHLLWIESKQLSNSGRFKCFSNKRIIKIITSSICKVGRDHKSHLAELLPVQAIHNYSISDRWPPQLLFKYLQ